MNYFELVFAYERETLRNKIYSSFLRGLCPMKRALPLFLLLLLLAQSMGAQAEEVPYRCHLTTDDLSQEDILALAQGLDGCLYVGTKTGWVIYDGERFRFVTFPDSIGESGVQELFPRADTTVWAVTGGRVMQVREQRVHHAYCLQAGSVTETGGRAEADDRLPKAGPPADAHPRDKFARKMLAFNKAFCPTILYAVPHCLNHPRK